MAIAPACGILIFPRGRRNAALQDKPCRCRTLSSEPKMTSVKRLLFVVPTLAVLSTALAPAAQARDGRNGALAVGALLGLGAAALATGALAAPPGEAPAYNASPVLPPLAYAPGPLHAPPPGAYAPPPMAYVPVPVYEAPPPVAYVHPRVVYGPPSAYAVPRRPYKGHWISYGHHRWHDEDDD
jgi:hypothetical protein